MNRHIKSMACFFLLWMTGLVHASGLVIEITQGIDDPTPIAISPFSWSGSHTLAEDVSGIVTADLKRSGLFDILPKEDMLSHPDRQQNVYFRDWRALKREYLLIGRMKPVKNNQAVQIDYYLYNIYRQEVILGSQLVADNNALRDAAHSISDKVFEALTNIPGAFSTRMLYVSAKILGEGKYNYQLFIADADGERASLVLNSDEPIVSPTWSPDAREIAYVSFEDGRPAIYRQVLKTGKREKLTNFKGLNSSPAWSPDGKQMAMVLSKDGSPDIYVMDLATRKLRKVAKHNFAIDTEPQWMPDGQSLVFTSNRGGKPQIYRVDLHTGAVTRVTYDGDYNARARVMPDGSGLIMVHRKNGRFHIARYDTKRGRTHVLTSTELDESPSIAANGSMVMYATKRASRGILAAVSIDGQVKFNLPSAGRDVREPAWSPFKK